MHRMLFRCACLVHSGQLQVTEPVGSSRSAGMQTGQSLVRPEALPAGHHQGCCDLWQCWNMALPPGSALLQPSWCCLPAARGLCMPRGLRSSPPQPLTEGAETRRQSDEGIHVNLCLYAECMQSHNSRDRSAECAGGRWHLCGPMGQSAEPRQTLPCPHRCWAIPQAKYVVMSMHNSCRALGKGTQQVHLVPVQAQTVLLMAGTPCRLTRDD